MCSPLAGGLMMGALGIGQAVVRRRAAMRDYDAGVQEAAENKASSLEAVRVGYEGLTLRQLQERDAHVQEQHLIDLDTAERISTARVMSAESGVTGNSADLIIRDLNAAGARNRQVTRMNWRNIVTQLHQQGREIQATGESRINAITTPERPRAGAFIIDAIAGGLRGYTFARGLRG